MGGCVKQSASSAETEKPASPFSETDAEVRSAMTVIEKMPESAAGYNQLATIYINRARQTGDFSLNSKAESAVNRALELEPADFMARKLNASLHATFHRFDEALRLGNQLKTEYPSDSFSYGVLTDANVELGNYADAVASAQKMVDLKPNSSSYARVGQLRSLHGDHNGALEMFRTAARTADPADREAQSWCLTSLGKEYLKNGDLSNAERSIDEALSISPQHPLANVEKARILAARADYDGAANYLSEENVRFPSSAVFILRGDIAAKQGKTADSETFYRRAEETARNLEGDMHPFALFWANRDIRLDEALEIAQSDYETNKDIFAADILAWCLYKKGRFAEAKQAINQATRLKSNDAGIQYHAGMIDAALGNRSAAIGHLNTALKLNTAFDIIQIENARQTLASLKQKK